MSTLRSPISLIGGKSKLARAIVAQFPPAHTYDIFVDAFGGGANILLSKPAGKHLEVYNDLNGDLVNCWKHLRNHPEEMAEALRSLPYSRQLYYEYHASLHDGTQLEPLERAVRWYYVLASSFRASVEEMPSGWINGVNGLHGGKQGNYAGQLHSHIYRRRMDLLAPIAERFKFVEVDCRDFEEVVKQFERVYNLKALVYCDPPYIGAEGYYTSAKNESMEDFHQRLARVLNETPAMVALSYYAHPLLEELYPASKWRRVSFDAVKHSQRTKAKHDKADEILLMNYQPAAQSLWDEIKTDSEGVA